jgi:hypothetical protein
MNSKWIATLTTILGAAAAALALVPYRYAHIASGVIAAILAALHPANAGIAKIRSKNASA